MKLKELQPVLRIEYVELYDENDYIEYYDLYNDDNEFCGCEEMFKEYGDREVIRISEFCIVIKNN